MIRVLVAATSALVRAGREALLVAHPAFMVLGSVPDSAPSSPSSTPAAVPRP